MSDSDYDDSPFAERKTNRMVWIVPSVLLHVIILVVWLSMPKAPPREPTQRKLTINSQQAQQLQQHVEDANLVLLHAKVGELQEIKRAMAQIRESRMDKLRSFETKMVEVAPADAADLFRQLADAQSLILENYKSVMSKVNASAEKTLAVKERVANQDLEAAWPSLQEIDVLHQQVKRDLSDIDEQSLLSFALVNSGEVRLDWILNTAITDELAELKQAMEMAREAKHKVDKTISSAYNGKSGQALDRLVKYGENYIQNLKDYEQNLIDTQRELDAGQAKYTDLIAASEKTIRDLEVKIETTNAEIKSLGNAKENQQTKKNLLTQSINLKKKLGQEQRTLSNHKRDFSRLKFQPDRNLQNKEKSIKSYMGDLFSSEPDTALITEALQAQVNVTRATKALLETLAQSSGLQETQP